MKRKLFAAAIVTVIYVLFVVVLTGADNQGRVAMFLSEIGLSNTTAFAAPGNQVTSDANSVVGFRDPMPPPLKKPAPPSMN